MVEVDVDDNNNQLLRCALLVERLYLLASTHSGKGTHLIYSKILYIFFIKIYTMCLCAENMSNSSSLPVSWYSFQHSRIKWFSYLIFVIFLHEQNFWRIKFTPKKRVNYDKIHRKLPIFCVITAKYTVNCKFFALNL